jgi:HSP20 family molecular chaperone IbpA
MLVPLPYRGDRVVNEKHQGRGPIIEKVDGEALDAEIAARQKAVGEIAFELAKRREGPPEPLRDWLDAERTLYRRPAMRLALDGDRYAIAIELPGVAEEAIRIRCAGSRLEVRGTLPASPRGTLIDECGCGEFVREVALPDDARAESLTARLAGGLLEVVVARAAPADAPPIAVETAAPTPPPLPSAVRPAAAPPPSVPRPTAAPARPASETRDASAAKGKGKKPAAGGAAKRKSKGGEASG